jgi:hypothetical protein
MADVIVVSARARGLSRYAVAPKKSKWKIRMSKVIKGVEIVVAKVQVEDSLKKVCQRGRSQRLA